MALPDGGIVENEEFIDWVQVYIGMEADDPDRDTLRKQLVKDWFSKVGPTAIDCGPLYYYDKEQDEIRWMAFITVA